MIAYIFLSINILLGIISTVISKNFQLSFSQTVIRFCCYIFVNCCFGSIFLTLMNGFKLNINKTTFIFALVYSLIVACSLTVNLIALSRVHIPLVSITSLSGNIITSFVFGIIFLNDSLSFDNTFSVLLILAAIIIPYLKILKSGKKSSLLVCVFLFINGGTAVIIQKLFTLNPNVTDSRSYFALSNILLAILSGIVIIILACKDKIKTKELKSILSLKQMCYIGINTVISNFSSLIQVFVISKMPLAVYSVTTSSLSLISSALISKFYFKEKINRETVLSIILAVLAIIL